MSDAQLECQFYESLHECDVLYNKTSIRRTTTYEKSTYMTEAFENMHIYFNCKIIIFLINILFASCIENDVYTVDGSILVDRIPKFVKNLQISNFHT